MNIQLNFSIWHPIVILFFLTSVTTKSLTTEVYPLATINPMKKPTEYPLSRYERGLEDYDEEQLRMEQQGRGMMYGDEHVTMSSQKAIKNDPWQGYYDFLINEGSFKFWAAFEVITAAVLIYSAFAAVYYAKYNFVQSDYEYGDYYLGRSDSDSLNSWTGLNVQTVQRILDAISSKQYS